MIHRKLATADAPSTTALSYSALGIPWSPPSRMSVLSGATVHAWTRLMSATLHNGLENHSL